MQLGSRQRGLTTLGLAVDSQVRLIDRNRPDLGGRLLHRAQAVKDFLDFATGGNAPPLMHALASQFGIQPPQGNLYSLLKGRFGTESAIPAAPVSGEPQPYYLDASITDGNADSQLISTGIPLRRYPLR